MSCQNDAKYFMEEAFFEQDLKGWSRLDSINVSKHQTPRRENAKGTENANCMMNKEQRFPNASSHFLEILGWAPEYRVSHSSYRISCFIKLELYRILFLRISLP